MAGRFNHRRRLVAADCHHRDVDPGRAARLPPARCRMSRPPGPPHLDLQFRFGRIFAEDAGINLSRIGIGIGVRI